MRKLLLWIGVLVTAAVIYNLDAIWGQWKFERLCKNEGGPRFYEPVEKNAGWQMEGHDTYDYQAPFLFEHVAFVRFEDKKGKRSDVRTDGYIGAAERRYIFSDVDETKQVRYSLRYGSEVFATDDRFSKTELLITDLRSGKVVASYTKFGYEWTKPERVLLSAPTGVGCWNLQEDVNKFYQSIYSIGSKK